MLRSSGRDMAKGVNYHEIAVTRARDVKARTGLAVFITTTAWYVTGTLWPLAWFAAFTAAQLVSVAIGRPMQRDPELIPSRPHVVAYLASVGVSASMVAVIAPLLWFAGGLEGRLFAMIVLMGSMLNVALQA